MTPMEPNHPVVVMDHAEAIGQMAVERYLLNELTPELRDAFEQHMFDCPECALDLRAAAAFLDEAKVQLPGLAAVDATPTRAPQAVAKPRRDFFAWMRPAFAVPVFAALLLVIGYQNLATIPGLRTAASEPRVLPWTPLHAGTRGGAATPVIADRRQGAVVLIDLPDGRAYASYALNLYDPQGKQVWAQSIPASLASSTLSVLIPGAGLQQGAYALAVSGVDPGGTQTEIDRRMMEIHFSD